jgi:hypothetical protein
VNQRRVEEICRAPENRAPNQFTILDMDWTLDGGNACRETFWPGKQESRSGDYFICITPPISLYIPLMKALVKPDPRIGKINKWVASCELVDDWKLRGLG